MSISIPADLLNNPIIESPPMQAQIIPLCKPPVEGMKCMTLTCDNASEGENGGAHYYNLANGTYQTNFSQIAAMMIDATGCDTDITLCCLDTGFIYTVPAGNQQFFPVPTTALEFYIIFTLNGVQTTFASVGSNKCNIFIFNQYIQPFQNNDTIKTILYGVIANSSGAGIAPFYANYSSQSDTNYDIKSDVIDFLFPITTLAGVQCSLTGNTTGNIIQNYIASFIVLDAGSDSLGIPFLRKPFVLGPLLTAIDLWALTELSIQIEDTSSACYVLITNFDGSPATNIDMTTIVITTSVQAA